MRLSGHPELFNGRSPLEICDAKISNAYRLPDILG